MRFCFWCGVGLVRSSDRGYIHPGGSKTIYRCQLCGFLHDEHPQPDRCPGCGKKEGWYPDHTVFPVANRPRKFEINRNKY